MEITIRKITNKNDPALKEICEWFDSWYEWEKPKWTLEKIQKYMNNMVCDKVTPAVFVAEVDGTVVGTAGIDNTDSTLNPSLYPWIVNTFVKKEFRNNGICTKLISHIKSQLKNAGYKEVYIRTDNVNLYEKMGFVYTDNIELDSGIFERLYICKL